ncbi:MAG: 3'-5' exonuclease [Prevotellaceae bacterium]|jgi:DNA polymerase-3 subunit epsilon|nr:3'-5' exonuclease [Prevotellaceae bacterium]
MQLNLKNPLVVLDLETTGVDVSCDRIVEISIIKVMPDGSEEVKTRRINPTIPIPAEVIRVHGITNDDVKDCPTFKDIAKNLAAYIEGCDIAGYNSIKFDVPLLVEEFLRAGVDVDFRNRHLVDVQNIFHRMEQRTLVAAYKFYCQKDLTNAHSAEADTRATYDVLLAQLDRYHELQNNVAFLAEFSSKNRNVDYAGRIILDNDDNEIINFGKYKGRKVADVLAKDPGYYSWIMNGHFTLDTKRVLTKIRLRSINNGSAT